MTRPLQKRYNRLGVHSGGIAHPSMPLTLANGSNVDIGAVSSLTTPRSKTMWVSSPTADAVLHGLVEGVDGHELRIYWAAAHQLTFKHESTTETTATRRLHCVTGADIVLPAPPSGGLCYVDLQYIVGPGTPLNRWVVLA